MRFISFYMVVMLFLLGCKDSLENNGAPLKHKQKNNLVVINKPVKQPQKDNEEPRNNSIPINSNEIPPKSNDTVKILTTVPVKDSKTTDDKKEQQEYWLFAGNPGVGKSTLINSIMGKAVAKSGISFGQGLTNKTELYDYNTVKIIDTPGLEDINPNMRKKAALGIEESLKKNGNYRIFFIITPEAGRARAGDLTMINMVMDSIKIPEKEKKYNVIVNKASKGFFNDSNSRSLFENSFLSNNKEEKISFYYLPRNTEFDDQDNQVMPLDAPFKKWLSTDSKDMPLDAKNISKIADNFTEQKMLYEQLLSEIKNKADEKEQEYLKKINKIKEEINGLKFW